MKKINFLCLVILLFITACGQFGEGEYEPLTPQSPTEEVPYDGVTFKDVVKDTDNAVIMGATVTLYADDNRYSTTTDTNGSYKIEVPQNELPTEGYLSIRVGADGYKPHNLTYEAAYIDTGVYGAEEEILMNPCPNCIDINGEKSAELFHLGDDAYAGAINSQFQKSTDGTELSFQLANSQEYAELKVSFQAKGLNPPVFPVGSSVVFGENVEEVFLWKAPEDGSFGTYEMTITNSAAINSITVITRNHGTDGSDYDDWEFTCLHVEGK